MSCWLVGFEIITFRWRNVGLATGDGTRGVERELIKQLPMSHTSRVDPTVYSDSPLHLTGSEAAIFILDLYCPSPFVSPFSATRLVFAQLLLLLSLPQTRKISRHPALLCLLWTFSSPLCFRMNATSLVTVFYSLWLAHFQPNLTLSSPVSPEPFYHTNLLLSNHSHVYFYHSHAYFRPVIFVMCWRPLVVFRHIHDPWYLVRSALVTR